MSTKTTFKRIALVAVAALGLGVMTSVAPASAAALSSSTNYVTSISAVPATTPVAGTAGAAVTTAIYFKTSTTAEVHAQPNIMLVSAPATSAMGAKSTYNATLAKGVWVFQDAAGTADGFKDTTIATTDVDATGGTINRSALGTKYTFATAQLKAWYDVAGTYVWTVWNDINGDGAINGTEYATTYTQVVGDGSQAITATLTAVKTTSATTGSGALVKVSLTNAGGTATNVNNGGGVKLTVSGSGKISSSSTYTLGRLDFNGAGNAWVNVTNTVAETVSVSVSGVGSTTVSGTAASITYAAATGTSNTAPTAAATSYLSSYNAALGATIKLQTGLAQATPLTEVVTVTDASGTITGLAGAAYSYLVTNSDSDLVTCSATVDCGAFTVATGFTQDGQSFTVAVGSGSRTITAARSTITGGTLTVTAPTALYAAKGATLSFTITSKDANGNVAANTVITPSLSTSSRNYGLVIPTTIVTGSTGKATFTYTDVSTSTTVLVDSWTFTDNAATTANTATATVTYTNDANLGVETLLATSDFTSATGVVTVPAPTAATIETGDGTETATGSTVSVSVKDVNGNKLTGVPVVFSISGGTGAALALNTTNTVYSSAGVASAKVYAWVAGTYTVTATVGTKTSSAPVTFAQITAASARVVSATANGSVVTAKVVDRFGNPVKGVAVTASSTAGYFGTGSTSASCAETSDAGTCDFVLLGGSGAVTVSVSETLYPQTIALAGSATNLATGEYTATVAATATAAASGVGAAIAPAGVNSATVEATGVDSSAQAATDAAAEATDAANAATDAANAAAEAADAATAAAQDAADAVAALSTQVATYISNLRKQITALTNLVIKIQKKVRA
jgi:hypothetical protein